MIKNILNKKVWLVCLFIVFMPLAPVFAFEEPIFRLIEKAEEKAHVERIKAEKKIKAIDNYYKKGKASYQRGNFSNAVANFKELLKIEPDYKPAKLYLKWSIIQDKISAEVDKVNSIKLKMADITADYDRRIKQKEGLALTYLLEQALLRCQSGDFDGAEYYYNLCYKLDPRSKEDLSWFVNATYELKDLSKTLDEIYRIIEKLPELDLEELASTD